LVFQKHQFAKQGSNNFLDLTLRNFSSKKLELDENKHKQKVQSCYKVTPKAYKKSCSFVQANESNSKEIAKTKGLLGYNTILRNHSTIQKLRTALINEPYNGLNILIKVYYNIFFSS